MAAGNHTPLSLFFPDPQTPPPGLDPSLAAAHLQDEAAALEALLPRAELTPEARERVRRRATAFIEHVRREQHQHSPLDRLMHEYDLTSEEGVVLMCLAEALLRIPDPATADQLIQDKLGGARWERHLGAGRSLFVNASTWGLLLTGRLVELAPGRDGEPRHLLGALAARAGEPVIRAALRQAMHILAHQFVMGRDIDEALRRSRDSKERHSFDMLGEAALTAEDAEAYFEAYANAIEAVGHAAEGREFFDRPGISVKLSALHPRYEYAQRERVLRELPDRLGTLAQKAKAAGVSLTVDAEEARRLELSLEVFRATFAQSALHGWEGLGVAVQSYQKRAPAVIDWLADLADTHNRRIPLRLVKGAYWDSEIKAAQQQGLKDYPVFTRKANADIAFLACARQVLADTDAFYPQFATHNAHTLAAVLELAGERKGLEFQRLHGMGEALYEKLLAERPDLHCRVYAPVGGHEVLLPYLVRRLLENGANTSFVNRIVDRATPIERLVADPVEQVRARGEAVRHPRIPLPRALYGRERANAAGICLDAPDELATLAERIADAQRWDWSAVPLVGGKRVDGAPRPLHSPADRRRWVGEVTEADAAAATRAVAAAADSAPAWRRTDAHERAALLERAADLIEEHGPELMALCVREGGRALPDALSEVREAVDFCRYYAQRARTDFALPVPLPGPTGEQNALALEGRGVFACISPWNFPVSIFTGQVAAALAAGNTVVAKPAHQTPLCGYRMVRLLHEAGIPGPVLNFLPGPSGTLAPVLLSDENLAGVAFTGSTDTARRIEQTLAAREGPIVPLIAETGGQNAMIVDSSALPEQVVADVLQSAFASAGQRCSALRVLFIQEEAAERTLTMLRGAMAELRLGDPMALATDVGPVIDAEAKEKLERHIERMRREARLIFECPVPKEAAEHGTFVAPCAFEIERLTQLSGEVFGPVLHVIRYAGDRLDEVIKAINATGYGLTLGIHSRIDETARYIYERTRVGNVYVNRNMIGAVVGVQPFGGMGLSGTGPKAGGPGYLHRFAVERTLTVNTAAAGGNAALLADEGGE